MSARVEIIINGNLLSKVGDMTKPAEVYSTRRLHIFHSLKMIASILGRMEAV